MKLQWRTKERDLIFKFDAGTSRGVLKNKLSAFLILEDESGHIGIGEAGPLKGLSPEFGTDLPLAFQELMKDLNGESKRIQDWLKEDYQCPSSIKFAMESAYLDIKNGGKRLIYDTGFYRGEDKIPINGLVWMGDIDFMKKQILQKLQSGYSCIKIKIGAIDIEDELALIFELRKKFGPDKIEIRVDANGAFSFSEAREILKELHKLKIHSIEQPIAQGNIDEMAGLCADSKIPIALDEELIGIRAPEEKRKLLKEIKPQYIVLKPGLHGGLSECSEWIRFSEEMGTDWWITSALESNIGLNAIAQFVSKYPVKLYQGLGTGQLYENNIDSPLTIHQGKIYYDTEKDWDLSSFE